MHSLNCWKTYSDLFISVFVCEKSTVTLLLVTGRIFPSQEWGSSQKALKCSFSALICHLWVHAGPASLILVYREKFPFFIQIFSQRVCSLFTSSLLNFYRWMLLKAAQSLYPAVCLPADQIEYTCHSLRIYLAIFTFLLLSSSIRTPAKYHTV